jgi:hypothetical protein|tara:strand:+ start:812 stop:1201 length:390 start_codon:yes stop_codon:yes gene_type:complete
MTKVFVEAMRVSPTSYIPDDGVVIHNGFKICLNGGNVKVYDTTSSGSNYQEISERDYQHLRELGWMKGTKRIKIDKHEHRIERLNERIRRAVIERWSEKSIEQLKNRRIELNAAYAKAVKEFNEESNAI